MTSNALVPVGDLEKMANAISASRLFGQLTPEQAMALMLVAQAENLHPATAARDYHVIQGRPTLKADAMLSRHLSSGGSVEWHDYTDQRVSATFSHPQGGKVMIDWDFARAKQAGLGNKDMWLKYPRQMLRARVISEGVKTTNPGVATGFYTPEEVSDFEPAPAKGRGAKAKDMGNAEIVTEQPSPRQETAASSPLAASPSSQPPVGENRSATLQALCSKTTITLQAILDKAGCKTVEEMSDEDYEGAVAMLQRKINAKK